MTKLSQRIILSRIYTFTEPNNVIPKYHGPLDTVWHNDLSYKHHYIHHSAPPPYLTSFLKHYYFQRTTAQVRIQNSLSHPVTLSVGIPHGTVLSPTLFNLYIADLPSYPTTTFLLSADDTTLYAASFHTQTAMVRLQYHLNLLSSFYSTPNRR